MAWFWVFFWRDFPLVVSFTGCARDMDLAIRGGPAEQGIPNLPLGKWGSCNAGPPLRSTVRPFLRTGSRLCHFGFFLLSQKG